MTTTKPQSTTEPMEPCPTIAYPVHVEPEPGYKGVACILDSNNVLIAAMMHPAHAQEVASVLNARISPASTAPVVDEHSSGLPNSPDIDPNRKCWASTANEICIDPRGCDDRGCQLYADKNYTDRHTATNKALRDQLIAAHTAAAAPVEQQTFRNTKEAMLYAQRNNIPAVAPVSDPSTSAREAAEEIAAHLFATIFHPAGEGGISQEREAAIAAIIERHFYWIPRLDQC